MYELCCDMIDLLINMSEIYGRPNDNDMESSINVNGHEHEFTNDVHLEEDESNHEPLVNGIHQSMGNSDSDSKD
jgi:hypothetical protein